MPEYNAIQSSRLERWARRLLGVRNGGIMPTIAPELAAAINLPLYLDTDHLAGYDPWSSAGLVSAVAGQFGGVEVVNAFVDALVVLSIEGSTAAGASTLVWFSGPTYLANPVAASTVAWRDSRLPQASFPLGPAGLSIRSGQSATAPPPAPNFQLARKDVPARETAIGPTVVLAPGGNIVMALLTANQDVSYSILGWTRHVDFDELNG